MSHRNIQLLSMKPRSEKDAYADDLRTRRRSSLINLILGAPSRGPRFSDDLCSLNSHISECNFGIEFFPDYFTGAAAGGGGSGLHPTGSISSTLRLDNIEDGQGAAKDSARGASGSPTSGTAPQKTTNQKRRRSSLGSLTAQSGQTPQAASNDPSGASGAGRGGGGGGSGSSEADDNVLLDENNNNSPNKQQPLAVNSKKHNHHQLKQAHQQARQQQFRKPSLSSTLASIDLTSSFEKHDKSDLVLSSQLVGAGRGGGPQVAKASLSSSSCKVKPTLSQKLFDNIAHHHHHHPSLKTRAAKGRLCHSGRVLRRSGSELSLYSTASVASGSGGGSHRKLSNGSTSTTSSKQTASNNYNNNNNNASASLRETKLIIMLQVCLPFILAGFGNMAAGLVLNRVAQWRAFHHVPIFFVLLPPFVGLKGNIEMTLASRLSTLANLNLLDTSYQRQRAYVSNLVLILSQAIGLSIFAAAISILCEFLMGKLEASGYELIKLALLVIVPSALATAVLLVILSSFIMSLAIGLANLIQVNPDNLSTLIAALYGDVSCVLVYGLFSSWMFSLNEQHIITWPLAILSVTLISWPALWYLAYKFKETHNIAVSSIPPMLLSIMVSMGSGAVLSLVVGRFSLIALYQPVVNGFGANLIAVQASRVSTWLWCTELRRLSLNKDKLDLPAQKTIGSLATFTESLIETAHDDKSKQHANKTHLGASILKSIAKIIKTILWSFFNPSPNSIAARLLLMMLIPAHTLYFFVIWLLSPANYIVITWPFYLIYMGLCLVQVFILLTICQPLMTLLMNRHMDPDIFGISLLMALADLTGTLCLAGAFFLLSSLGDVNAK